LEKTTEKPRRRWETDLINTNYTVACPLKAEIVYSEGHPLLGYGTIKSDATKEYIMLRHVTNGSTDRNGILCECAMIVTSCNNRRTVGNVVFCWRRPEAISRGPTGQADQESRVARQSSANKDVSTEPEEYPLLRAAINND
jgi:hypothetical protein